MINLTVSFGPQGAMWTFLFKKEADARKAFDALLAPMGEVNVTDDFGASACFKPSTIHGLILEDLEGTGAAAIERGLQQARNQVQANRLAGADPVLKTAQMLNGGLPMGGSGHPFMGRGN